MTPVATVLYERLIADADALGDAADLVQAAIDGDEALSRAVSGAPPVAGPASTRTNRPQAQLWLRSLTVAGFRGIGPEVRLDLPPGPGLHLVVGRNGSGKSSLAEGLEVLLTGTSGRFAGRSADWREGWRNLGGGSPQITATLHREGAGPTTLVRTWATGDALEQGALSAQGPPLPDLADAMVAWRPLLGGGALAPSTGSAVARPAVSPRARVSRSRPLGPSLHRSAGIGGMTLALVTMATLSQVGVAAGGFAFVAGAVLVAHGLAVLALAANRAR